MEPYLRLFCALEKREFSLLDAQKALKTTGGSAKVVVSRLKAKGQLFSTGNKGKFVMMKPQNHVRLRLLAAKNPRLHRLASEIYSRFPLLRMLVLFGSQVTGGADARSDFDVLLVLPTPLENRKEVAQELEKKLKIKLHFTAYSEHAYRIFLYAEAHVRLWLSNGMIFDETVDGGLSKLAPPIAKRALMEEIFTARTYLRISRIKGGDARRNAGYLLTALRLALIVNGMAGLDYDYSHVRERLDALLGKDALSKIRAGARLSKEEFDKLSKSCSHELRTARAMVESLKENESDNVWNKALVKAGVITKT